MIVRRSAASGVVRGSSRATFWQLVRVEARAFGGAQPGALRGALLFARSALSLWAHHVRVHPSGQALCLLGPRPWRVCGAAVALLVFTGALGTVSRAAALSITSAVLVVLFPSATWAISRAPSWRAWKKERPPRPYTFIGSLASVKPGAGAQLVQAVVSEAAAKGQGVVLDADNDALVRYYERLGFLAFKASQEDRPLRPLPVRMWRPPCTE
ncbi:MAG TPA: hypothetical protein VME20_12315 [Acidimicrobiales bacterium]|nr:hypothetical protein [Acidimicrobiales bacterium]